MRYVLVAALALSQVRWSEAYSELVDDVLERECRARQDVRSMKREWIELATGTISTMGWHSPVMYSSNSLRPQHSLPSMLALYIQRRLLFVQLLCMTAYSHWSSTEPANTDSSEPGQEQGFGGSDASRFQHAFLTRAG